MKNGLRGLVSPRRDHVAGTHLGGYGGGPVHHERGHGRLRGEIRYVDDRDHQQVSLRHWVKWHDRHGHVVAVQDLRRLGAGDDRAEGAFLIHVPSSLHIRTRSAYTMDWFHARCVWGFCPLGNRLLPHSQWPV